MEASSHGLDQHRLDGVRLAAAAFTNLGRDHMDYHPTVEHYLGAKLRLFTELLMQDQPAVVNMTVPFPMLLLSPRVRVVCACWLLAAGERRCASPVSAPMALPS
jgi:UDP-N-acetylmuramoylalanine-D-glutamate ligase